MVRDVVLGLLRSGECLHGYALVKSYRELTGAQANSGNFYRELQRLSAEGLVRPAAKVSSDPRRTQYEITQSSAAEFDAWFARLADGSAGGEDDLSLRALFVAKVDPGLGRRFLQRWRDDLWLHSQVLERERGSETQRAGNGSGAQFPARASLLDRRLRHVIADLEFVDELRRAYEGYLTASETAHGAVSANAPRARRARAAGRGC